MSSSTNYYIRTRFLGTMEKSIDTWLDRQVRQCQLLSQRIAPSYLIKWFSRNKLLLNSHASINTSCTPIQKPKHKQKHQTKFMHVLRTVVRFKELTGSRIEVLKFKIIWSFQGHAKSFCMPLLPPQDVLREAPRTSTHISKVEQFCISLLYQGPLQKETEEILLTQ